MLNPIPNSKFLNAIQNMSVWGICWGGLVEGREIYKLSYLLFLSEAIHCHPRSTSLSDSLGADFAFLPTYLFYIPPFNPWGAPKAVHNNISWEELHIQSFGSTLSVALYQSYACFTNESIYELGRSFFRVTKIFGIGWFIGLQARVPSVLLCTVVTATHPPCHDHLSIFIDLVNIIATMWPVPRIL